MNHFEGRGEVTGPLPWEHLQPVFLIAGVSGVALCGLGMLFDRPAVLASYLTAYLFWLGIALGCKDIKP